MGFSPRDPNSWRLAGSRRLATNSMGPANLGRTPRRKPTTTRGDRHRKPGPSGKSPYCKAAQLGISKESEKENALMKSGPEKRTDFFRG